MPPGYKEWPAFVNGISLSCDSTLKVHANLVQVLQLASAVYGPESAEFYPESKVSASLPPKQVASQPGSKMKYFTRVLHRSTDDPLMDEMPTVS